MRRAPERPSRKNIGGRLETVSARSPFTVADLFSGAGGISEGFRQAGFQVVAGLDNDPDASATFGLNFPDATSVCGDIRTPAVREQLLQLARSANVIVGGPPCQAFSQVRNHTRVIEDPRNQLYREFVATIQSASPLAFVMENVTGMDQMGVREQITQDLRLDGGYRVCPQVLDAADFGVPQTRKRLLFIGVRSDVAEAPPMLTGTGATEALSLERSVTDQRSRYGMRVLNLRGPKLLEALGDPENMSVVSAEQAISDLAFLSTGNRDDAMQLDDLPPAMSAYQRAMRSETGTVLHNVQVPRINRDTAIRLRSIPKGGNHRDLPDALLERYITGQRWGQENGTGRLSRRHFYAYRRLHPDIWAWTLNTKADSVYHYSRLRSLSVREFARLQSFPDRFVFTTDPRKGPLPGRHDGGPAHSRYRQVGNAVPPLLARAAAEELLRCLQAWAASSCRNARTA